MDAIGPNKPIQTIAETKTRNGPTKPGKSSFDAVFKQSLDAGDVQPPASESLTLASGIHPAQFASESKPSEKAVVDQIHMLVDTLAAYHDKLADRGASLKEVAPIVQQMESQNKSLSEISGATGRQDSKLQEMVNQSLMLSTLEISKYRSGYYNDG